MRGILLNNWRYAAIASVSLLALSACSSDEEYFRQTANDEPTELSEMGKSLENGEGSSASASASASVSTSAGGRTVVRAPKSARPPLAALAPEAGKLPPFSYTDTQIAERIRELRGDYEEIVANHRTRVVELARTRQAAVDQSRNFHGTVSAIEARLQQGTTPGNPVLIEQWTQAQTSLSTLGAELGALNTLATNISGDSAAAAYLSDMIDATLALPGAVDEDHRQLHMLDSAVQGESLAISRLLSEVSDELLRQSAYVANQQSNLGTLALGIKGGRLYGESLANRAFQTRMSADTTAPQTGPAAGSSPLIVIRFDRPDPVYEQPLYNALARALERKPGAQFDLVAVSPKTRSDADAAIVKGRTRNYAEGVVRAVTDMGLPAERLRLSSATSARVNSSEVHIYVR